MRASALSVQSDTAKLKSQGTIHTLVQGSLLMTRSVPLILPSSLQCTSSERCPSAQPKEAFGK